MKRIMLDFEKGIKRSPNYRIKAGEKISLDYLEGDRSSENIYLRNKKTMKTHEILSDDGLEVKSEPINQT